MIQQINNSPDSYDGRRRRLEEALRAVEGCGNVRLAQGIREALKELLEASERA